MNKKDIENFLNWFISAYAGYAEEDGCIQLTLGTNSDMLDFGWQSGDNSFTGGAYSYPNWAVIWVEVGNTSDGYAEKLAEEVFSQWENMILD